MSMQKQEKLNKNINHKLAFTLAEVLIALAVIGIVAAITIPNIMVAISDMQYKTEYKQAVEDASNAVNNCNRQALFSGVDMSYTNFLSFMSQFGTTKTCVNGSDSSNNLGCWNGSGEQYGSFSAPYANAYAFIDTSGRVWSMPYNGGDDYFFVDTNGNKSPNQWGKDRFALFFQETSTGSGILTIKPFIDNFGNVCVTGNKCATDHNYYGTTWLIN